MESHRMFSTLISFWVLEEKLVQVMCESRKRQQSCPWSWSLWRFPARSLSHHFRHTLFSENNSTQGSPPVWRQIPPSVGVERAFSGTLESTQFSVGWILCSLWNTPPLHSLGYFLLWLFHEELAIQQLYYHHTAPWSVLSVDDIHPLGDFRYLQWKLFREDHVYSRVPFSSTWHSPRSEPPPC